MNEVLFCPGNFLWSAPEVFSTPLRLALHCILFVTEETAAFIKCCSDEFGSATFLKEEIVQGGVIDIDKKKANIIEVTTDNAPEVKLPEGIPSPETAVSKAYLELREKAKVKRGGWVPDFNDTTQYKYWPVFDMRSGFAYSYSDCTRTHSGTMVGSRLCFPTEKMAKEFALENIELYRIVYCTE